MPNNIVRNIKIFSSATMPQGVMTEFWDLLEEDPQRGQTLYEVGSNTACQDYGTPNDLDVWLKTLGAEDEEWIVLHHGNFPF